MDGIIWNSKKNVAVIRSMIVGFEVTEAYNITSIFNHIDLSEPAILFVYLVNDKKVMFEVTKTDEELKPLVERFVKLY